MNETCEKVLITTEKDKPVKNEELRNHEGVQQGKIETKFDLGDLSEKAVLV